MIRCMRGSVIGWQGDPDSRRIPGGWPTGET